MSDSSNNRSWRLYTALIALLAFGLAVSVFLTVVSVCVRSTGAARYELAQLGLEDVAHRVEQSAHNLATVQALNRSVLLSRARSLAQLIAENPAILDAANRDHFNSLAKDLNVDEIHVTDEKGVLIRSLPASYEGYYMGSSAQSAAFLPALTNSAFAYVQDPQIKGIESGVAKHDWKLFQYAGVARRDRAGIVQVGCSATRIHEAMRMADVGEIARTTRIGRDGKISITPLDKVSGEAISGVLVVRDGIGEASAVFESDCAGYRITVSMPLPYPMLSSEEAFEFLTVLDLILFLLLLVSMPTIRIRMQANAAELRALFRASASERLSVVKLLASPLTIVSVLLFALLMVAFYIFSTRQARGVAEERLRAAATDIVGELDSCVGRQLAYVGKTICERFGTPEAMKKVDMDAVMEAYGLDELNAIDSRGVIAASNLPIIGDNQWKKVNPAKFNRALLTDKQGIFAQWFRPSADEPDVWYKYVGVAFPPPAEGYLQLGFNRVRMQNSFDYTLNETAVDWHIGEHGFYVISKTANGEILSTLDESLIGQTLAGVGFDLFTARANNNVERRDPVSQDFFGFEKVNFFESEFNGQSCICTSGVANHFHRYIAAIPLSEVYGPARRTVVLTAIILFLALLAANVFISRLSKLVARLKHYINAEKERQQGDLTLAKTIQTSSLPMVFPEEDDYKIFAMMDTAKEVGGDFYDFYALPDGRVLFLIADVSGKGVPAALFMMRAKATVRASVFEHPDDLALAIAEANNSLAEKNDAEMFVTAWVGVYDRAAHEVTLVNAGHNPPLVKRADGTVEWVRARGGLALAAMGGVRYRTAKLALMPGDSLFLYTDGVTEAMNGAGDQYGEPRLEATLRKSANGLFVKEVRRDVTAFVAGAEQSDDITMLALDLKPQIKEQK